MEVMQPCRNSEVIPEVEGVQAFPPAYLTKHKIERKTRKMNCPKCGKTATLKHATRKITTAAGIGAGGYVAASSGALTGAAIGTAILPGIGTLAGSILGILIGSAAGGAAGNAVGKFIDEGIVRTYHCDSCGYEWRAA